MKAICKPFNLYFQLNIHFKTDTMKKLLLFAVIALFTSLSQAQSFSRAFANYNGLNNQEAGEVVESLNGYYYITAEESGPTQNALRVLELNTHGDFLQGFKVPVSNSLEQSRMLGVKLLASQYVVKVYFELQGVTNEKLLIVTLNLNDQTLSEELIAFNNNVSNLSRITLKNDLVIVCGLQDNVGLVRFAFSTSNNTFSEYLIDATVNFSIGSSLVNSHLVLNGTEFLFCRSNKTLYRFSNNNLEASRMIFTTSLTNRLVAYDNHLIFYDGGKMTKYNLVLDSILTRTIFPPNSQAYDLTSGIDGIYLLQVKGTGQKSFLRLNSNLQTIDSTIVYGPHSAIKLKRLNNKISVVVNRGWKCFEGNMYFSNDYAQAADLVSVFDEFNQFKMPNDYGGILESSKYEYLQTGHANNFSGNYQDNFRLGINDLNNSSGLLFQSCTGIATNVSTDSAATFSLFNNAVFVSGPISDFSVDGEFERMKYSYIYHVTRQEIETHLLTFQYPNPNYVPPIGIRLWPAHGDISKGQAPNLAPFVDVNNNGVYEPMLGDYPKIMGDECLFKIYHHPFNVSNGTGSDWLQFTFRFKCDTNELVNSTIFSKTQVIPRFESFENTYLYTYNDFDLGNLADDYTGCHVDLGMVYTYNADDFDENFLSQIGFKSQVPAIGNLLLKGVKKASNGLDDAFGAGLNQSVNGIGFGDGVVDNEHWGMTSSRTFSNGSFYPYAEPHNIQSMFHISKGLLSNGDSIVFNGIPINQTYFGNSDPLFYASGGQNHGNNFSEITQNNPSGDRRILASSGPGNFAVGDTLEFIQAWIVSLDTTAPSHLNSVEKLFLDAAKIKQYYVQNHIGCGKTFDGIEEDLALEENERLEALVLYPNPTNGSFRIKGVEQPEMIKAFSGVGAEVKVEMENGSFVLKDASPGIYLIQVRQGPTLRTARLTVF